MCSRLCLLLLFVFLAISSCIAASEISSLATANVTWDEQYKRPGFYPQAVSTCKGGSKVAFVAAELGVILRTLDGVTWSPVPSPPKPMSSTYWYGVYCFPDAKRVIVVGFADGADKGNGAIMAWSQDGGDSWGPLQYMPLRTDLSWLQSVKFADNMHGITLPFVQDSNRSVIYYTTTGGQNASDWIQFNLSVPTYFWQDGGLSVWPDGVARTIGSCGFGVGYTATDNLNVYRTADGGATWDLLTSMPIPSPGGVDDILMLNKDVAFVVGGTACSDMERTYASPVASVGCAFSGFVLQSVDGGRTWTNPLPQLKHYWFTNLDYVITSNSTAEVWAVSSGATGRILHAVVSQ